MGLVHHEQGVVGLRQAGKGVHVAAVAVHAEHRLGNDHPAGKRLTGGFGEQFFKMGRVVVVEKPDRAPCQPAPHDDAVVVEAVRQDQGIFVAQGRQQGGVGLVAGVEHQGGRCLLEPGQLFFHPVKTGKVAADQAGGGGAGAPLGGKRLSPLDQQGVARQAQVVVGTDIEQPGPVDRHHGPVCCGRY